MFCSSWWQQHICVLSFLVLVALLPIPHMSVLLMLSILPLPLLVTLLSSPSFGCCQFERSNCSLKISPDIEWWLDVQPARSRPGGLEVFIVHFVNPLRMHYFQDSQPAFIQPGYYLLGAVYSALFGHLEYVFFSWYFWFKSVDIVILRITIAMRTFGSWWFMG